MVVKGKVDLPAVVALGGVVAFRAKVVEFVVILVLRLEERIDVICIVAVRRLEVGGRKAHGDDLIGDVREVKIEIPFLVSPLRQEESERTRGRGDEGEREWWIEAARERQGKASRRRLLLRR